MKNFALLGAAGYIAPRHMKAIRDTNNNLVAAMDKFDSVGIIDSYFPDASFFTEFERFDRHIDKLRRKGEGVDYLSICTPNYLHDAHIRFGLRNGIDVICEKPLVLNPWNAEALLQLERETGNKVYTILQLRHHKSIIELKKKIAKGKQQKKYDVDLSYYTSRGKWYEYSWKGENKKSGGIATNIGVHFFDMLCWVFGEVIGFEVIKNEKDHAQGIIELEKANVKWRLSINYDLLPEKAKKEGKRTFRSINIEGEELEFSDGFTELHTTSYEEILKGNGYGIQDAMTSIQLVNGIRNVLT